MLLLAGLADIGIDFAGGMLDHVSLATGLICFAFSAGAVVVGAVLLLAARSRGRGPRSAPPDREQGPPVG